MDTFNSPQSLWNFALEFYAKPHVLETCLFLQDQHGVNVCMLIALRWLDERGVSLTSQELVELISYTQQWTQEIIEPLRELRRKLKRPFKGYALNEQQDELRISIKHAELLSEKKLLMEIDSWTKKISETNFTKNPNVKRYLIHIGLDDNLITFVYEKMKLE